MSLNHQHAPQESVFYRGMFSALWQVFGQRRLPLVAAVVLRMLASLSMAVPVAMVAWAVEQIRAGAMTTDVAVTTTLVVVGAVLLQYALWFGANYFAWVTTFLAVGQGRLAALRHVQSLPVGVVAARGTGDIGAVLSADHEQVAVFAHHGLMNLVGGATLPIAALIGLALVDAKLAGVVTLSLLAVLPVLYGLSATFEKQALARADTLAAAGGRIVEYVQGIATARSYHQLGPRLAWYRQAVARMRQVNDELATRIAPLSYVSMGVMFLGCPLLIAVFGYQLAGGQLDALTAVVFLVVVLRVYAPAVSAAMEIEGLRLSDASLRRIGRVRDLAPQAHPAHASAVPTSHDLACRAVSFGYSEQPVLRDLSFVASAGTLTAVVGPSGAGKSTLLSLLARFHDPSHGEVTLGGVPLSQLTRDQLFEAVTVVFQDVYLFAGTIRDNICFGRPDADAAAVEAAAKAAHCDEFIQTLPQGYDTRIGEGGMTLSGGERQRLSIARAILKDAPVLLMDEVTSALDPINEQAVQRALEKLVAGRTVIVVAHRLSTIRSADQILVMRAGEIVQRGTHDALIRQEGLYAHLWGERERAARWRLGEVACA
ncbi:MAG: ABC transporter ATP-binding protein [Polyangiales bacterium]